jgi:putative hemolysin
VRSAPDTPSILVVSILVVTVIGRLAMGLKLESLAKRGARSRLGWRAPHPGLDPLLVRSGALEARLATTEEEISRAQRLRYRVFFEEGGAIPSPVQRLTMRDVCLFDGVSDHLIVVDGTLRTEDGSPECVGVYRMLRQDTAQRNFGFYSSIEFDVESLIARHPRTRFLEVGRACVAETHRGGRVLELLWRGLWAYARYHNVGAIFGCASLPRADSGAYAGTVRCLAAHGGDPAWRTTPRTQRAVELSETDSALELDASRLRSLPPLVKGYWRLGATFSPIPAIDHLFDTVDLFVVLPLHAVEPRYLSYFEVEAVPRPINVEPQSARLG